MATDKERLARLEESMDFVKTQVSNHLPHQIEAVQDSVNNIHNFLTSDDFKTQFANKNTETLVDWTVKIVLGAVIMAVLGLVIVKTT